MMYTPQQMEDKVNMTDLQNGTSEQLVKTFACETGTYRLSHKLVTSRGCSCGRGCQDTVYSVLAVLESEEGSEACFVYDVSRDQAFACRLLSVLSEGLVTPCLLSETVGEFIASEQTF